MSFIPVMQYLAGIAVFGIVYWFMDGIVDLIADTGISETGSVYTLLFYLWAGILIVYLVFGAWWLIRLYDEREYSGGGV